MYGVHRIHAVLSEIGGIYDLCGVVPAVKLLPRFYPVPALHHDIHEDQVEAAARLQQLPTGSKVFDMVFFCVFV